MNEGVALMFLVFHLYQSSDSSMLPKRAETMEEIESDRKFCGLWELISSPQRGVRDILSFLELVASAGGTLEEPHPISSWRGSGPP